MFKFARNHGRAKSRETAPTFNIAEFLRAETVGGVVLLLAAALALIAANSPLSELYTGLRDLRLGPASLHLDLTVGEWAKDGLLAIFFFVVGLELKRELVVGELSEPRKAMLPALAALGGMITPAVLAFALSAGTPGAEKAWAIPVATDIAFALGVLAVTGSFLPTSARVFLLSLAIVDDLGGILIIAVAFTSGLSLLGLCAAVVLCAGYWFAQHRRLTTPLLYVPLALATWLAVHESGIHATLTGVALGLLTRVRSDAGESTSPSERLEHRLQPWSAGLIVPVFAFFAAGVPVDGQALGQISGDPIAIGIMVGLVAGKLIGITGASFLAVKLGLGTRPEGVGWGEITALALLGGIGFTVSLLIAELALDGGQAERAKAAVLIASAIASLLAAAMMLLLRRWRSKHRHAG